jgi:hypothetical protein
MAASDPKADKGAGRSGQAGTPSARPRIEVHAMKHKVRELQTVELDIAAAMVDGRGFDFEPRKTPTGTDHIRADDPDTAGPDRRTWTPRRSWDDFAPILRRDWPAIARQMRTWFGDGWPEAAELRGGEELLCWFVRAYVASNVGDDIDLPDYFATPTK